MGVDMGIDTTAALTLWVAAITLLAVTVQSAVGFGSALISAPSSSPGYSHQNALAFGGEGDRSENQLGPTPG